MMSYTKPQVQSVHFPAFKASLPSMEGKTVAITGTTSGTGYIAAKVVAELGAKVLLLNRPSTRAEKSYEELRSQFPAAELHAVDCDLQDFASVRDAVQRIKGLCPEGIHVLANNAGVMALEDVATKDGYDIQMQTNHLSHFLLTAELMPLLEKAANESGDSRVVHHSSVARLSEKHLKAEYLEKNGGNLGGNSASMFFGGARWVRYSQTKLANAAFTAALHHKLQAKNSKVKALVAHPGLANTNLQVTSVEEGGMGRLFTKMFMRFSQSQEDGAMGLIACMCLPEAKSGQFYGPGKGIMAMKGEAKAFALEPQYDNEDTRNMIWEKSNAAVGLQFDI